MLAAALLLIAQPAAAAAADPSSTEPLACPAPRIGFAPPLDGPLLLTRTIERDLARGRFVQTVRYHLRFTPAGRGYRMRWQQIGQHADGPAELLRLLSLQDVASEGELLDFTLDSRGALIGVSESPESPQRLASAIARLRADRALTGQPERERKAIADVLDRLEALPPHERARLQLAKASRLLDFAAQPCTDGHLIARDGRPVRITATGDEWLILAASDDQPAHAATLVSTTLNARVSLRTGLVETLDRITMSSVAGTRRASREQLIVRSLDESPVP